MKTRWTKFIALFSCFAVGNYAFAADDALHHPDLSALRIQHPRLLVLNDDIVRIKRESQSDPFAQKLFSVMKQRADEFLVASSPQYSAEDSQGLASSRLALKHITTLAGMFRLTGDRKYAERAKQEVLEIACFSDWGVKHFLNVAEMTAAMSIGYDWLYDEFTPDEQGIVRRAIVRNGLQPGLQEYRSNAWWTRAATNWNFVCNGGLTLGAIAVADEERELSEKIFDSSLKSVPIALKTFAPDGGWPEGPGYWAYGTRYLTYLFAALHSSLGSDFNLSNAPGVSETGFFRIYSESPTGLSFNFADSETEVPRGAQMFWLSHRFKQPVFAGAELHIAESSPEMFHLLFYSSEHKTPGEAHLPLNKIFTGTNLAFFRSAWSDPKAFFVGFKGGDNWWSHSHADLGSFVFDAAGFRWAEDLGPDNYDLPGYFREKRFDYYRLQTRAHNTITVDGENQPREAHSRIVSSSTNEENPFAIVDLSQGYGNYFHSIKRGIKMIAGTQLIVQDEFEPAYVLKNVTWHLHTRSTVTILPDGQTAVLQRGDGAGSCEVRVKIISGSSACFTVEKCAAPEGQAQQPEVSDLTIKFENVAPGILNRLAVSFMAEDAESIKVKPLSQW